MTYVAAAPPRDRLLAERTAAQLLAGPPARTAEAATERLLAIQGQDPRGARLAIRARSRELTAADIDHALTVDRSLVISWLNRGTLHLVRSADYWRLHQLTTPQLATGCFRRLGQEGLSRDEADRGVAAIEQALADHGPLARDQLAGQVSSAGLRTAGQALVFLLFLASLRGIVVRGPMAGQRHAYVLTRDWLGAPPAADRDAGLGWLARRYLAGHGPATGQDLAKWAGLPLRDARRALAGIGADLQDRGGGLASLARPPGGGSPDAADSAAAGGAPGPGEPAAAAALPTRLLGPFDPVLHGWRSREPVLGSHERALVRGGMFLPFAMVRGRAIGGWSLSRGKVQLPPLDGVPDADRAALAAEAADVERFLGLSS